MWYSRLSNHPSWFSVVHHLYIYIFEISSIIRIEGVFVILWQCFTQHMQGFTMEWVSVTQTKTREGSILWHITHSTLILKKIIRSYCLLQLWVASETWFLATTNTASHQRKSCMLFLSALLCTLLRSFLQYQKSNKLLEEQEWFELHSGKILQIVIAGQCNIYMLGKCIVVGIHLHEGSSSQELCCRNQNKSVFKYPLFVLCFLNISQ